MLVTGVFPSRAPNVAVVQFKDITFGVPYALFDAANERFLPLG